MLLQLTKLIDVQSDSVLSGETRLFVGLFFNQSVNDGCKSSAVVRTIVIIVVLNAQPCGSKSLPGYSLYDFRSVC